MARPDFKRLYYYGALFYAFLIPFHQQAATIALILWALFSVFNYRAREINQNPLLWVLPTLYFIYFIGVFTSEKPSLRFLEHKLSFVVFPFIFFLHAYDFAQRKQITRMFVLGLVSAGLVCILAAVYRSIYLEGETVGFHANVLAGRGFIEAILYGGNHFFGEYLSIFHQTVYFALYLCSGVVLLLFCDSMFSKGHTIAMLLFFVVLIFLVSNKAALLVLGIIFIVWLLFLQVSFLKKGIGLLSIFLVMCVMVYANPRARESIQELFRGELILDKDARYGAQVRLLSWDAALTLIKGSPILGYGTGDVQAKLNAVYENAKYKEPLKEELNAHNQWFQSWLENGAVGLLVLLLFFILLFKVSLNNIANGGLVITLIIVLFVNTMFESIFNRFSGISFFAFVSSMILTTSKRRNAKQ